MAQTATITLTVAGTDTGPFDLYSDADSYTTPFESGIAKSSLIAGYVSVSIPDAATIIRVQSLGICDNFIDLNLVTTTTTTTSSTSTTTSTSTSTSSTSTTTSTTSTTTTAAGNSGLFGGDAGLSSNACSALTFSPATYYWSGILGIGTILYTNAGHTTPVTGWIYVAYDDGGGANYYSINSGTGQLTSSATPC